MRTATRNALAMIVVAGLGASGLALAGRHRKSPDLRGHAIDAIPNGALLVATVSMGPLRAAPELQKLLHEGREIPGLGRVDDVCGFDPFDSLDEIAIGVPAAGDSGDFGLAATGKIDDQAILDCASKVINARGGHAVTTTVGSFRDVRDASSVAGAGEIAVKRGGPLLLGGGAYLRAMVDAADGKTATVRSSAAHEELAKALGDATMKVTIVLSPEQRAALVEELGSQENAAASVVAAALGATVTDKLAVHGLLVCNQAKACADLARTIDATRAEKANDTSLKLVGFGDLLASVKIDADGPLVHARVAVPMDHAAILLDRLFKLGGFRHPMPKDESMVPPTRPEPMLDAGAPPPDETITVDAGKKKR